MQALGPEMPKSPKNGIFCHYQLTLGNIWDIPAAYREPTRNIVLFITKSEYWGIWRAERLMGRKFKEDLHRGLYTGSTGTTKHAKECEIGKQGQQEDGAKCGIWADGTSPWRKGLMLSGTSLENTEVKLQRSRLSSRKSKCTKTRAFRTYRNRLLTSCVNFEKATYPLWACFPIKMRANYPSHWSVRRVKWDLCAEVINCLCVFLLMAHRAFYKLNLFKNQKNFTKRSPVFFRLSLKKKI